MPESVLPAAVGDRRIVVRALAIALVVFVADQATKWWLLSAMLKRTPYERIVEVTSFFNIVLVWNRGVSFGMFNNDAGMNALVFSLLAAVIVGALLWWLARVKEPVVGIGIGLVVGGAVGNVVDRLWHGAVVDFLDFHVGGWHWPAFNIADAAICVGVALMVLDGLFARKHSDG